MEQNCRTHRFAYSPQGGQEELMKMSWLLTFVPNLSDLIRPNQALMVEKIRQMQFQWCAGTVQELRNTGPAAVGWAIF